MPSYAPIVLFVYSRPEHTRKTVEALAANSLASVSDLYIFSDAPKGLDAEKAVEAVRAYIRTISGFSSVIIEERERNYGLADSIIDGVTRVVGQHGKVIVVEDDIVTSPYFLQFMNDALETYEDEERVMHISGYMFDIDPEELPESFFLLPTSCWGWGTWARAWRNFNRDIADHMAAFTPADIFEFNLEGVYDYWSQLLANYSGKLNTWAVFWYASTFRNNGLSLHPRTSLTHNIGHDGSGVNCGADSSFELKIHMDSFTVEKQSPRVHPMALLRLKNFWRRIQSSSEVALPRSPLSPTGEVVVEFTMPTQWLIDHYNEYLNIDTARLFQGIQEISLYRCRDTGLRFYAPAVVGDEDFYTALQTLPWYCLYNKEEYRAAVRYIASEDRVLEVGAGKGYFSRYIPGNSYVGLELSGTAVWQAQAKGIDLRQDSVEEHSRLYPEHYDVVCAFQVIEHIADVYGFLQAMLTCLRPGGHLLLSMPCEDSFVGGVPCYILNMPPHHITRWSKATIQSLCQVFALSLIDIYQPRLEPYHYGYYAASRLRQLYAKIFSRGTAMVSLADWKRNVKATTPLTPLFERLVRLLPVKPAGHDMLAVFQKKSNTLSQHVTG